MIEEYARIVIDGVVADAAPSAGASHERAEISGGLTHAHALPVSRDVHTYTQFGSTFEPWEYTDWIDERCRGRTRSISATGRRSPRCASRGATR